MDPLAVIVILIPMAVIVGTLMWRPYRGRRRTIEDVLESEALEREQDQAITDATYGADASHLRHH
jgi:hypothetical protein